MVDIKEPRNSLLDYLVFRAAPGWALLIAAGTAWLGYYVLGIHNLNWLAVLVVPATLIGTSAFVYLFSVLAEPKSRKARR